jgi:hypothetical protein
MHVHAGASDRRAQPNEPNNRKRKHSNDWYDAELRMLQIQMALRKAGRLVHRFGTQEIKITKPEIDVLSSLQEQAPSLAPWQNAGPRKNMQLREKHVIASIRQFFLNS